MADYSWVALDFRSQDPEIVREVQSLMGTSEYEQMYNLGLEWTRIGGETSYGTAREAESFLTEKGIAWSRYSDGKYDYDGDEAHWKPGMDEPRVFTRLNNEGRCMTAGDLNGFEGKTEVPKRMDLYARIHEALAGSPLAEAFLEIQEDAEVGAFVREFFAFSVEEEVADLAVC